MTPEIEEWKTLLPGLAQRYQHLRAISRILHHDMMKTIDRDTLLRAAEMLEMLQDNTVIMDSDIDGDFIADFAIFGVFTEGENVVQRFHRTHPQTDPDRRNLLEAMSQAIFTFAGVVETYPLENAVVVEDLFLDNRRMLLADHNLSADTSAEDVVCARLIHIENFWMTTGLGFYMGINSRDPALMSYIASGAPRSVRTDPDKQELLHGEMAASVVNKILRHSRSISDEYDDDAENAESGVIPEPVKPLSSERIERNAPCPCGSGKKYKKCCGR